MYNTTFIGNITKDCTLRKVNTASGEMSVCDLDIAVNYGRRNEDGKQNVIYIRATAWRGLADVAAKYLGKGQKVYISTEDLHARAYTTKDGKVGASMECTIKELEMLGGRKSASSETAEAPAAAETETIDTANLPF